MKLNLAIIEKETNFIINVFLEVSDLKIYNDKINWIEGEQLKEIVGITSAVDLLVFPEHTYLEVETTLTEEAQSQILDKSPYIVENLINEFEELKQQNALLILDSVKKENQISDLKRQQAALILSLTEKGVL
ncbi:hypothetical protein [Bacillus mobilis]|uniref:hypothetical protein n=1 Tax=Bacillus mobilis TaxID=2026190 RepID=UPI002E1ED90E|nr:hypothetical protein [Bacillus mobilis]MED0957883.1 hypothetical protein [Bacillus mobilis]